MYFLYYLNMIYRGQSTVFNGSIIIFLLDQNGLPPKKNLIVKNGYENTIFF